IEDNNWFFDTELLILAEKMGYRIYDVPVKWIEDTDTRVKIASTVTEDLRGLLRLRINRPWRRAAPRA
ncbi:MAG TPA: glycosyl transferase family 2, partial [Dehalococcoidia bacterium]|nr:glycosyl transferase family 2 [Dehalococcoidia bacterium]